MIATFIIAFFLLVAASYIIIRSKRPKPNDATESGYFPPPARGLFDDEHTPRALPGPTTEAHDHSSARRADELRGRATRGELEVLNDAELRERPRLYREVLDTLVANVDASPEKLAALASLIARSDELRATKTLGESLLRIFKEDPARIPAADLLRVAALADDARIFLDAVNELFEAWRAGRLTRIAPADLSDLIDAEYHALAPATRYGGSAYVLKEQISDVRRQLRAAGRARRAS